MEAFITKNNEVVLICCADCACYGELCRGGDGISGDSKGRRIGQALNIRLKLNVGGLGGKTSDPQSIDILVTGRSWGLRTSSAKPLK